jgi:hypothetical protein
VRDAASIFAVVAVLNLVSLPALGQPATDGWAEITCDAGFSMLTSMPARSSISPQDLDGGRAVLQGLDAGRAAFALRRGRRSPGRAPGAAELEAELCANRITYGASRRR